MSLVAQTVPVLGWFWGGFRRSVTLQDPGLSPNQLWGELMGLAVHQHLSVHHRVTLPWRPGTDSGVKNLKAVETCQIPKMWLMETCPFACWTRGLCVDLVPFLVLQLQRRKRVRKKG